MLTAFLLLNLFKKSHFSQMLNKNLLKTDIDFQIKQLYFNNYLFFFNQDGFNL